MKKIYNLVLIILTIVLVALMTFAKLNEIGEWVDLTKYETVLHYAFSYGPMVLLCFFAFGGLISKMIFSKLVFVFVMILLVVFTIAMFAPNLITKIIG